MVEKKRLLEKLKKQVDQRRRGGYQTYRSTHHDRTSWFAQRIAWPLRDASPEPLEKVWEERESKRASWKPGDPSGPRWESAGPKNIAGRITALAVPPDNPLLVYAGTAGGGVWRSRDGGKQWQPIWPDWVNPNIGSLAIDPHHTNIIYCGTGEANLSGDAYAGSGVYRSMDGGDSWILLAGAAENALPRRIGALAVHPYEGEGKILYLGGITLDETMPAGFYASDDGGITWNSERTFGNRSYWCHSIVFHPARTLFATIEGRGSVNGVWRLDECGWTQAVRGMADSDTLGRIALAIAPSNPDILYAVVGDWRDKSLKGIYRSTNAGDSWLPYGKLDDHVIEQERFMSYANSIAVHPTDPDFVLWGGRDLYQLTNGKWVPTTHWENDPALDPKKFSHADHHAIVMPGGDLIYAGTDGGLSVSEDRGKTWSTRARGMETTMFWAVDVAPTNSNVFGGGTQDNGTLLAGIGGTPGDFQCVEPGDGGWMAFDPTNHLHAFCSSENITLYRHKPSEDWTTWHPIGLPESELEPNETAKTQFAVVTIESSRGPGVKALWTGSDRLWHSGNYGVSWQVKSPVLDGSVVSAIEVSRENPELIFAGTTRGGIFRSRDGGKNWSGNLAGPDIPGRVITQIRMSPNPGASPGIVVTVGGSGMVSRMIAHKPTKDSVVSPTENTFLRHVFRSRRMPDGGLGWDAIDSPTMPDVAYHAAVFERRPPYRLFVGNDCGVWMRNEKEEWVDFTGTLPNAIVSALAYHEDDQILFAATHGRGIWRIKLGGKPTQSPA